MDEGLRALGQACKEGDELPLGGGDEGGARGITFRRSEMNVLRRMADRIPTTGPDRHNALTEVMKIINGDFPPNYKINALRVFAVFEKVNIDELKAYISTKLAVRDTSAGKSGSVVVNNQVVVTNVSAQAVLDEYSDVIAGARISSKDPAIDDPGKQVHSAETNGKAS